MCTLKSVPNVPCVFYKVLCYPTFPKISDTFQIQYTLTCLTFFQDGDQPKPAPRSKFDGTNAEFALPDLPSVPDLPGTVTMSNPNETKDDIDFDDLTKRFEDLKKKK